MKIKEKFHPVKYKHTLYEMIFLPKQGSSSVDEYSDEFLLPKQGSSLVDKYFDEFLDLTIKNRVHESDTHKMTRYKAGLLVYLRLEMQQSMV